MTFIGRRGSSVIDYAICNVEAWEEVHMMKIEDRVESKHRPIEITLEKIITREKIQEEEKREIEDWSEEECKEYKQKLKERTELTTGAKEEWAKLAKEIRKAVTKKKIKRREIVPGKRTWDNECRESKTKLNRVLREMTKGKIERRKFIEMK